MGDPARAAIARSGNSPSDRSISIAHTSSTAQATDITTTAPGKVMVTTPSRADIYPFASLPGLPAEKLQDILAHLPLMDILRLGLVSRGMNDAASAYLRFMPAKGNHAGRKAEYLEYTSRTLLFACEALKKNRKAALLEILPWQPGAKEKMAARMAQLSQTAGTLASGLGRRFHDIAFTLNEDSIEIAGALIQSQGWSHLELHVGSWDHLRSFLWQLIAVHTHPDAPVRKLSIVCMGRHAFPEPQAAAQLLESLPAQLQLVALRLPGCPFEAFQNVIATSTALEQVDISLPAKAQATDSLMEHLPRCPNLKGLALSYTGMPGGRKFLPSLIKKINDLKLEAFSLDVSSLKYRVTACLAGLVSSNRRQLVLSNLFFMPGSLAGFGDALARSQAMQSLAFSDCTFFDVTEFEALLAGVAGSVCLSQLTVLDCSLRGQQLDEKLLVAAGKCTALTCLEISTRHARRQAEAVDRLRQARPDLHINVTDESYLHGTAAHRSSGQDDSSSDISTDDSTDDSDSEDRNFRINDALAFAQLDLSSDESDNDNDD